mgnify:CR=1 FL=1
MDALQQLKQPELNLETAPQVRTDFSSEAFIAKRLAESPTGQVRLLESILERTNMRTALRRVLSNDGAPGVDGMTCRQLCGYLKRCWPTIRQALLDGTYTPQPVKRCEIPKPDGGVRLLGIPAALDRLIQQAVAQVLTHLWDHTFSDSSHGFRPGRSQRGALTQCRAHVQAGYRVAVDLDLSKFFDRVNHDRLMSRLAARIADKRVLRLIRRYLTSGVMIGGLVEATDEGTPQGGPLSPLLSNIVLDELDRELENRNLHFVRYADDCVIYVKSIRAGERVMASVTRFIEKRLRLKVNRDKSAVGRPWDRKYLGMCTTNSRTAPKLRIHWKSIQRFKQRVRELTCRTRGRSVPYVIGELMTYINGWWNYYGITESFNRLKPLAHWVRRRLRALIWYQWKNYRTRVRELKKRGVRHREALLAGCARKGAWRMSKTYWVNIALPDDDFTSLGLVFPWT